MNKFKFIFAVFVVGKILFKTNMLNFDTRERFELRILNE